MSNSNQSTQFENDLIKALLSDRKTDRIWRNIRFFTWIFIVLVIIILIFAPQNEQYPTTANGKPYVSLIRLSGIIMPGTDFSSKKVIPLLVKAFSDTKAKGVILVINSPGGSAVQASIIHDKIIQLKKKYHKKVVVLGVDTLASGGYLIATAADKIYVNADTLTGSIGVIMSSFGFTDTIHKLGITRRVFTAGENKDRMDPFQPLNPQDVAKVHHVLNEVHQSFIDDVLQSRGKKLRGDTNELFSGDFWTGKEAAKLGLVDGTGNEWTIIQQEFNVKYYKNYSAKPSLLETIIRGAATELHVELLNEGSTIQAIL